MPERFEERPFTYRVTKDRRVLVSYRGRRVSIVVGTAAERLVRSLEAADEDAAQQLLARITGNFKRGNRLPFPNKVT